MDKKAAQAPADAGTDALTLTDAPSVPLTKAVIPSAEAKPDMNQPEPGPSPSTDWQAKFSEDTHQYVREYIRNADQKAKLSLRQLPPC